MSNYIIVNQLRLHFYTRNIWRLSFSWFIDKPQTYNGENTYHLVLQCLLMISSVLALYEIFNGFLFIWFTDKPQTYNGKNVSSLSTEEINHITRKLTSKLVLEGFWPSPKINDVVQFYKSIEIGDFRIVGETSSVNLYKITSRYLSKFEKSYFESSQLPLKSYWRHHTNVYQWAVHLVLWGVGRGEEWRLCIFFLGQSSARHFFLLSDTLPS